jgi:Putative peptidoglycan binding domain/CHAP domain
MSNTAESLLAKALAYVGTKGRPNTFTRDYAKRHGDGFLSAAWCDMFVTYCARVSAAVAALPKGDRAYTPWHAEDFQDVGHWYAGTYDNVAKYAKRGDIVFFDWGGSNTRSKIDHVGIVTKVLGDGRLATVEGNTSDSVAMRVRGHQDIAGFGRPKWDAAPKPPAKPTTASTKYPYRPTTIIRLGWMDSVGVRRVQDRLNALGYRPALVEDGDFGAKTLAAVKWYQRGHGLVVDGEVGPKTWAKLFPAK